MKLRVLWIGKTRSLHLAELSRDFRSRIAKFLPIDITELKEPRGDHAQLLESQGEKLLAALDSSDRVVALDPKGKFWTSEQFATFLLEHMRSDPRRLTFVIGGFRGLSDAVRRKADVHWALSPLTFTHDLARVLVLEQIYRALCIIHNFPYSK